MTRHDVGPLPPPPRVYVYTLLRPYSLVLRDTLGGRELYRSAQRVCTYAREREGERGKALNSQLVEYIVWNVPGLTKRSNNRKWSPRRYSL